MVASVPEIVSPETATAFEVPTSASANVPTADPVFTVTVSLVSTPTSAAWVVSSVAEVVPL